MRTKSLASLHHTLLFVTLAVSPTFVAANGCTFGGGEVAIGEIPEAAGGAGGAGGAMVTAPAGQAGQPLGAAGFGGQPLEAAGYGGQPSVGQAGTQGQAGSCLAYANETNPTKIQVILENRTGQTLYVGGNELFQLQNADGATLAQGSTCGSSCEDLTKGPGGVCSAPMQNYLKIGNGVRYATTWDASVLESVAMPNNCYASTPASSCYMQRNLKAGTYQVTAQALLHLTSSYGPTDCEVDASGTCWVQVQQERHPGAEVKAVLNHPGTLTLVLDKALVECGGNLGNTCSSSEYCGYTDADACGRTDARAVCVPRPTYPCPTSVPATVCGCDGKSYGSTCLAYQAGASVLKWSACN